MYKINRKALFMKNCLCKIQVLLGGNSNGDNNLFTELYLPILYLVL